MSKDGKQKRRGGKSRGSTERRRGTLRREALPTPLPRHRQPTINHEKLDVYLAAAAKFADDRNRDLVDIRKSGAILEEIVRLLKTGTDPASIQGHIESALEQTLATSRASQSVGDSKELLTLARETLGLER